MKAAASQVPVVLGFSEDTVSHSILRLRTYVLLMFHGHRFIPEIQILGPSVEETHLMFVWKGENLMFVWKGEIPYSYGPVPVISTYNPTYRMYNPTYNQL